MICWFCEEEEETKNLGVKILLRRGKEKKEVIVPRCQNCEKKHRKVRILTAVFAIVDIAVLAAAAAILNLGIFGYLAAVVLAVIITALIHGIIVRNVVLPAKTINSAPRYYHQINELEMQGYKVRNASMLK